MTSNSTTVPLIRDNDDESDRDLQDMFGGDSSVSQEEEGEAAVPKPAPQDQHPSIFDQDLTDMFGDGEDDGARSAAIIANCSTVRHAQAADSTHKPNGSRVPKKRDKTPDDALTLGKRMAQAILRANKKHQPERNKLTITKTDANQETKPSTQSNVYYRPVTMDQYWKNLLEWDFVGDLNETQQQQVAVAQGTTTTTRSEESVAALPNSFSSLQEYKARWSPLLLQEVRSQMLSELTTELIPLWSKGGSVVPVMVETLSPTSCTVSNQVTLLVRSSSSSRINGSDWTTTASFVNDVYCLVANSQSLVEASRGTLVSTNDATEDTAKNRCGVIGLATNRVKTLEGLSLKVSLKQWQANGKRDMFLTKIGSNVTSLREFTALSQMENILLKQSLLTAKSPSQPAADNDLFGDLLSEGGGAGSLGVGFRIYVKSKFNPSQIRAITAAAREYGQGGFTLVKGPPGTGKTTTLVALLNALHLRQYQIYYQEIERIATQQDWGSKDSKMHSVKTCANVDSLNAAAQVKPRILVCAPSNAAVDNVIVKITQDGFVDGNGGRYNPSICRVGTRQGAQVNNVALKTQVDQVLTEGTDHKKLESLIAHCKAELKRFQAEIRKVEQRLRALVEASPRPLSQDWEIRIDEETFEKTKRVLYVNHRLKQIKLDAPAPAGPGEEPYPTEKMPHYRSLMDNLVKYVERYNSVTSKLKQYKLVETTNQCIAKDGRYSHAAATLVEELETHLINTAHIVLTTLGSAGSKKIESAQKFKVVVVDEAAQSSEPATLVALQLGSSQAVLMGDPQQLPATIFSLSGRNTKYGRSLFQRLEEAGHPVHMLNTQYRMDPAISDFPRRIFYEGSLLDGPNVKNNKYGGVLRKTICVKFPHVKPFTILDLGSAEARDGTSLSNAEEVELALHLYCSLEEKTSGMLSKCQVAVITPYSRQAALLKKTFLDHFGPYTRIPVEISTIDAFQGKEADVVIFSCVRATGKGGGIGFLSDVQRMNVALTRAKHYLFVIASVRTIVVNPYWRSLVDHAKDCHSVIQVPPATTPNKSGKSIHSDLARLQPLEPISVSRGSSAQSHSDNLSDGEFSA